MGFEFLAELSGFGQAACMDTPVQLVVVREAQASWL